MSLVGGLHQRLVHSRRVRVLRDHLVPLLPREARVVDVGCGDGLLARAITERRPDVRITGIDVLVRPHTHVPVEWFDGVRIPLPDRGTDVVMLIDVLHHTDDPAVLLAEAARVARRAVLIKDHCRDRLFAGPTLRFMDWVGNAHHGVALPYNYWSSRQWRAAFGKLGLAVREFRRNLGLYAPPVGWVFDGDLHFIATLEPLAGAAEPARRAARAPGAPATP